ncbi:hypothetical protein O988_02154 [Pseudogymnoascus sp. VKM F-3808]|nr:hypothetical protein O988_02154 [Pseudogymnoascus sp. VKM F-3808]
MKLTSIVASSAALLSTSVLARSTVYVTVVTCAPTTTPIPTRSTVTVTVNSCPASDSSIPTFTDVSPTDAAPTGTDVTPTVVAPTDASSTDAAPTNTDTAPTDTAPTDTAPTDTGVPVPTGTPGTGYPIKGSVVNCRAGPGTNFPIVKTFKKGDTVDITCQTPGTSISGNSIWDLIPDNCFITDYYVKTGTGKYIKPRCDAASLPEEPAPPTGSPEAGPITNDYPYGASTCGDTDRWYYFACQCTSFVAWRINERLDIDFMNKYKGAAWGNADSWDDAAREVGVKVDDKPVPGSIAQTDAGEAGHVAWVASVDGDSVTIEEYNYVKTEGYSTRTLPASTFKYIHLKY